MSEAKEAAVPVFEAEDERDDRTRSKTMSRKEMARDLRRRRLAGPGRPRGGRSCSAQIETSRPKTRADCVNGPRPCMFVSCKHNLYLDVNPETGSIKLNFPDKEIWELEYTCALDVAEKGGITLEEVGEIMNLTRERIRQVETRGLLKLREATERRGPNLRPRSEAPGAGRVKSVDTAGGWLVDRAPFCKGTIDVLALAECLGQARTGSVRAGPGSAGLLAALDRRDDGGARAGPGAGEEGVGAHRRAGDPRRAGEDAPPEDPRRLLGRPDLESDRREMARAGHRADLARRGQPLPVPRDGGRGARASPRRSSRSTSAARRWCAPRRRTRPTSRSWSTRPTTPGCSPSSSSRRRSREQTRLPADAQGVRAHRGLRRLDRRAGSRSRRSETFPAELSLSLEKVQELRYGENPHQRAAFYREQASAGGADGRVLEGAAGQGALVQQPARPRRRARAACSSSPSRRARRSSSTTPRAAWRSTPSLEKAYRTARAIDEVSAFGGHRRAQPRGRRRGREGARRDLPRGGDRAGVLRRGARSPRREEEPAAARGRPGARPEAGRGRARWRPARSPAGCSVQDRDSVEPASEWKVVTKRAPTEAELAALQVRLAGLQAREEQRHRLLVRGPAARGGRRPDEPGRLGEDRRRRAAARRSRAARSASDAFFPFRDGLDEVAKAGATCVVQPGGSVRDAELIAAADEHGLAMVFTGVRHFRH